MCGILAQFSPHQLLSRERLGAATALMKHRGPDSDGLYFGEKVALGHRRLSIIDLAAGQQPMASEDGALMVVYNGEIYNFAELRDELMVRGRAFRTHSDTEVILQAYAEWGPDCVRRFNGMFAFALWDSQRERLWVVRDRLGIKPLYYCGDARSFTCASEVKPLLTAADLPAELNEPALDAYFTVGYVPAPETLFRGVRKLEPGHYLEITADGIRDTEYWDFADTAPADFGYEEAVARFEGLFSDCVRKCLVSDVPLGVFLSGGLDSSAVVSAMHASGVAPIETFTVAFGLDHPESEEVYAQEVAAEFDTRHHALTLQRGAFFESIRLLVRQCEEPIVEAASIALFHLAEHARPHVKVLLSGEGADELFAGYSLYGTMQRLSAWRRLLPQNAWRRLSSAGRHLLHHPKAHKYLDWLALPLEQRYRGTSSYLTDSLKRELYTGAFYAGRGDYLERSFAAHFERISASADPLSRMLYVDTKTWLPDNLLLKADKMTMAASVELRVPFLDHRLVEFAAALPADFKRQGANGKRLMKTALRPRLPARIVDRKKVGFPVPVNTWMQGGLGGAVEERITDLPWLNRATVRRVLDEQQRGACDHSRLILAMLILAEWKDEYLGGRRAELPVGVALGA